MRAHTLAGAAALAECAENTIVRVLNGENIGIRTAARIAENLGGRLEIRFVTDAEKTKTQHLAV